MKIRVSKTTAWIAMAIFSLSFSERKGQVTEPNYTIKGTVRGIKSDWVYFGRMDTLGKLTRIDSVQVINEKFEFKGNTDKPEYCHLGLKHVDKNGKRFGILFQGSFIIDRGNLTINCHKDSISKLRASGTLGQDQFNNFKQKIDPIVQQINTLHGKKINADKKKNKSLSASIAKTMELNRSKMQQIVISHIKQYPQSLVSAHIIRTNLSGASEQTLKTAYDILGETAKNSADGRWIQQKVLANNRTAIGNTAPYFELPDDKGRIVSLNAYKGKITLVDFWASWCGPCREENPNLIMAYQAFKGKGFEIVSISMDDNKTKWLNAIKEDRLPWLQLSDLKGSKSEVKKLYGITTIPMSFLLDGEGKILAANLRGTALQQELGKHLK